jgi:hypothetical protein
MKPRQHTPGPWRWEVSLKSKQISLCGGRPRFDLTVMDFERWGMSGARPRLLSTWSDGLMVMEHAEKFATIVSGREHHCEWFQGLDHPDARLIAAAPDLLAALKLAESVYRQNVVAAGEPSSVLDAMQAAIAQAEGPGVIGQGK